MRPCFFLLFAFLLAGCQALSPERVACPKAAILAEFSKTVTLADKILIRTDMDSLSPACYKKGNEFAMDMRLRITSLRPLSHYHSPLALHSSYFVAVVDQEGNVLSRTHHDLDVTFEAKQTTAVTFERLQEKIPYGKEVAVYVGFNLDPRQLGFLQRERARKIHDQRP